MVFMPNVHGGRAAGVTRDDVVALFSGQVGLFYDFSDPATMTVQTDGGGGVPGDDDPIGTIADLSTVGDDATAVTGRLPAFNATLGTGTFSSDHMIVDSALTMTTSGIFTFIVGYTALTSTSAGVVFEGAPNSTGFYNVNHGWIIVDKGNSTDVYGAVQTTANSGAAYVTQYSADLTNATGTGLEGNMIFHANKADFEVSTGGSDDRFYYHSINNTSYLDDTEAPGFNIASNTGASVYGASIHIGERASNIIPYLGDIGFVLLIDRDLTQDELDTVQTWASSIWSDIPAPS